MRIVRVPAPPVSFYRYMFPNKFRRNLVHSEPSEPGRSFGSESNRNASGLDCRSIRGTKHSGYQRCKV